MAAYFASPTSMVSTLPVSAFRMILAFGVDFPAACDMANPRNRGWELTIPTAPASCVLMVIPVSTPSTATNTIAGPRAEVRRVDVTVPVSTLKCADPGCAR